MRIRWLGIFWRIQIQEAKMLRILSFENVWTLKSIELFRFIFFAMI